MSEPFDKETQIRILQRAYGVSPERARALLDQQADAAAESLARSDVGHVTLPITLVLPWSHLISDDAHYAPALRKVGKDQRAVLVLTKPYREAHRLARGVALRHADGRLPVIEPVAVHGRVWLPDARIHDISNFLKCALDALQGIVYVNDHQVHRLVWERAGIDVDAPRAEMVITAANAAQHRGER